MNTKIIKSRKVERNDERVKNIKISKEANKTVALRLRKKLIERGRTPNLGSNNINFCVENFYAEIEAKKFLEIL